MLGSMGSPDDFANEDISSSSRNGARMALNPLKAAQRTPIDPDRMIPQLIENYTKGSADGISLSFLTVWFIGDICNFVGAVWAGLVPTVIALAVYFIFADLVLIIQCLYYNHINSRKKVRQLSTISTQSQPRSDEEPLLGRSSSDNIGLPGSRRRPSVSQSYRNRHGSNARRDSSPKMNDECSASRAWMKNTISVFLVCAAGTGGWFIAWETGVWSPTPKEDGDNGSSMAPGAQTLGYLSAICYLGLPNLHSARIPQILKNYRERSTDGRQSQVLIAKLSLWP
ncbi:MAG: hypothetical protein M1827_002836 [Pycnora praestabilis]|nr:MAG: hypothetical protein M1827_002836 [Pycnora praestabilis]